MLTQLACNTTSTIPRQLSNVITPCISCKGRSNHPSGGLVLLRRVLSTAKAGSNSLDHTPWPTQRLSSISRQIQETRELPALPTEPIVRLVPLATQRRRRSENIVGHDLGATVKAHYAANVLAHGSIHLDLNQDLSMKTPQRLAVTPPRSHDEEDHSKSMEMTMKEAMMMRIGPSHKSVHLTDASPAKAPGRKDKTEQIQLRQGEYQHSELHHRFMKLDRKCDAETRLDAEICVFEEWITMTEEEVNAARKSFNDLQDVLQKTLPDIKLELHGSRATGLARPLSDVDIRLVIPTLEKEVDVRGPSPGRPVSRQKYVKVLRKIQTHLYRGLGHRYQMEQIKPGRIPLLDIRDQKFGLTIQIGGIAIPTAHATEFTKYYQAEYPQIKTLFVLLRVWTEHIRYNDASMGGISSYLLFNMILTSITHSKELVDVYDVGKQLINFLKFWSTAKIDKTGYAPEPARTFPKFASNIVEDDVSSKEELNSDASASPGSIDGNSLAPEILGSVTDELTQDREPSISSSATPVNPQITNSKHFEPSDTYLEGIKSITAHARAQLRNRNGGVPKLILQDPANPTNNLGISATRFVEFQKEMQSVVQRLIQGLKSWDNPHSDKKDSGKSYLLQALLESGGENNLGRELRKLERGRRRLILAASGEDG